MGLVRHAHVPVRTVVHLEVDLAGADDEEEWLRAMAFPDRRRHVLDRLAVHREVDDGSLPVPQERPIRVGDGHLERAAEAVGDVGDRLARLRGLADQDRPVGAERPRRQGDVCRHAVVAAGAVPQTQHDDLRTVLHGRSEGAEWVTVFEPDRKALGRRGGPSGMDLTDRRVVVTGGAGLIGTHLAARLAPDNDVVVADDLSKGEADRVPDGAELVVADVKHPDDVAAVVTDDTDIVFHLAAYTDTNYADPRRLFEENTEMTYTLLERADDVGVDGFVFTSSSTVYGEAPRPTPEDYGPLEPISEYGASKLADEGLVSTYAHSYDLQAWTFRFANIVGPHQRGTVIPDFIEKLDDDPDRLTILGDGRQEKSYLHVEDCVDAICHVVENADAALNTYNLGSRTTTSVTRIADIVSEELGLDPAYEYTGGDRGWTGDVPKMRLSIEKLAALGWEPSASSDDAVRRAARQLIDEIV